MWEKGIVIILIWRGKDSQVTRRHQLLFNHPKYRLFKTKHSLRQIKVNLLTFRISRPSRCSPRASTLHQTATNNNSSRSRNRNNENSNKSSMLRWLNNSTHRWWVNLSKMLQINQLLVKWISNSFRILKIWSITNNRTPRLFKVGASTCNNRISSHSRTREHNLSFRLVHKVKLPNKLHK